MGKADIAFDIGQGCPVSQEGEIAFRPRDAEPRTALPAELDPLAERKRRLGTA